MDVKRTTNTFIKGDRSAPKSEDVQTSGASEFRQSFGNQSVGDVLNKVADPNWVDPQKKMRAAGNNQLDKDAFMKLMLTQMKYQDPQNPMQSHEMAAQLAQFTSLEQLNNIHTTLESMKNQQKPQTNYQALALIGKRVSGDSSKIGRVAGDTKHSLTFDLLGDASKVNVTVKDASGNVVRKLVFPELKKGRNSVEWNGLKEDGLAAQPGEYKVSVEGTSTTGTKIYAKTDFGGKITGLNYTPEGPVLLVGNQSIKLSDVKKIEDAGPDDQKIPATPLTVGGNTVVPPGMAGAGAAHHFMPLQSQGPVLGSPPQTEPQSPMKPEAKTEKMNTKQAGVPSLASNDENIQPAEDGPPPGNILSVPMSGSLLAQVEKAQ